MSIRIEQYPGTIFTVLCQNKEIFKIDRKTGAVKIKGPLPFGLFLEETDEIDGRVNNRANFEHWCATRILTLDRMYAKEILNQYGLKQAITDADRADIAIATKGLSLNDSYWINPGNKELAWETVNLFDNSLSNAMMDVSLSGTPTITNMELITPDISTAGVFPKAWHRIETGFQLYKGDIKDSVRKEIEASQILTEMGFSTVQYKQIQYHGNPIAVCDCITTKNKNIVSAVDVSLHAMNADINFTEFLSQWQESYDEMLLADYLVGNTDRHQENWGFFITAPEQKIIGLYPLMDFNHAFEANEFSPCLPEILRGVKITQMEAAAKLYSKYKNHYNFDIDFDNYHYGSYTKQKIQILKQWEKEHTIAVKPEKLH